MRRLLMLAALGLAGCLPLADNDRQGDFFFVRSDGADLPVWVRGNTASGVFLMLLPGGPGTSGIWLYPKSEGFQALERDYAVVYHDQRASGSSQGDVPAWSVNLDQFVVDTDRIVEVVRARYAVRDLILLGHSWGGMLGTAYLLDAGRQAGVRGWVEIDGAHNVKKGDALSVEWVKSRAQTLITLGTDVDFWQGALTWYAANPTVTNETLSQHGAYLSRAFDSGWVDESHAPNAYGLDRIFLSASDGFALLTQLAFRQYPKATPQSAWGDTPLTRMYHDVDLTPEMGSITVPSLIVWGAYDPVLPTAMADDALGAIGSSEKQEVILPHSAHNGFDEEPGPFADAVHAFVERVRTL
jgi:pimeloyl-ACP methyl ester carboxylesterase